MRSISRPLAGQSPLARPAAGGRPGQMQRTLSVVPNPARDNTSTSMQRRSHGESVATRSHHHDAAHRRAQVRRPSSHREEVRRRRTNVLFMLVAAFSASLFLAATTHAQAMMYALALTFLSLCAYCYRLVQLRQIERHTQQQDTTWFRAA